MIAVLISIRPKWCEKIISGEKTIEVRKTRPKMDTPFRGYIYRTKGTVPHIINGKWVQMEVGGTIIAEFTCDRIYELEMRSPGGSYYVKGEDQPTTNDVARHSCLTLWDMHEYLQAGKGYGWHISNLRIYDHPRDLWEFAGLQRETEFGLAPKPITRPPQSWRYVEEQI
jgi:predicted transcriptional regulator